MSEIGNFRLKTKNRRYVFASLTLRISALCVQKCYGLKKDDKTQNALKGHASPLHLGLTQKENMANTASRRKHFLGE